MKGKQKMRRGLKLSTRYAYLRRNAKTLTTMLEIAAAKFWRIAREVEGSSEHDALTPSDIRELSSECQRIAHQCGLQERGR